MFRRRRSREPVPVIVRNVAEFEEAFGPRPSSLEPVGNPVAVLRALEHADRVYLVDEHGEGWEGVVERGLALGTVELVVRADPRLEPDGRPRSWTIATAWDRGDGTVSLRWVQPYGDEEREHVVDLPLIVGGWS